ncbi:MAG TPA: ChaN family lipoprotein [bacterium]|nr:ChaN family lipoprotein [bacterium]
MPISPRAELLAIQKKLWRSNKELIDSSISVREPGFDSYERSYRRAVSRYERSSDQGEMIRAVLGSGVVYVGDYHTCNQSQRSFLRILKAVVKVDRSFMVGLELLHKKHQGTLDKYLAGRISEATFLKRIRLEEHWVFDLWESFKPLFDFCRYHRIPMYAIDAAPEGSDVRRRDAASAKLLARIVKKNPALRLFVLIGDLHLAPGHLPRDLKRELSGFGLKRKHLILFQNSEPIYWKLAEEGADERIEVVKLPDGNFCRMHTPPVISQRSYLNWLEHEEGEIDYADAKVSFLEIVDRLCDFLKIELGPERDEVEVFTCGDLSFLKHLEDRGDFSKGEISAIKRQILASESYYIAKAKVVYLANLSINHAAEEASHFIKSVSSGPEEPRELVDAFYANVLHEALGFFGSKCINHKRKCWHEKECRETLAYLDKAGIPENRRLEYETLQMVLEYKKFERRGRPMSRGEIFRSRMDLFLSLTHALGYMLGDRLFYGLVGHVVKKPLVRELFLDPWSEEGEPVEVYFDLLRRLKKVRIPKRM